MPTIRLRTRLLNSASRPLPCRRNLRRAFRRARTVVSPTARFMDRTFGAASSQQPPASISSRARSCSKPICSTEKPNTASRRGTGTSRRCGNFVWIDFAPVSARASATCRLHASPRPTIRFTSSAWAQFSKPASDIVQWEATDHDLRPTTPHAFYGAIRFNYDDYLEQNDSHATTYGPTFVLGYRY